MKDNKQIQTKFSTFPHIRGKQIVAAVREADYAHPGEEELIDLVLEKITKDSNRSILDVGCGLGGTAFYMQKNGWGNVTGIDIDEASIPYAIKAYPNCNFHLGSVLETTKILKNHKFDLITIFSAFYAFSNQTAALQELGKISKKDALLVIYEYTNLINDGKHYNYTGREKPSCTSCLPIKIDTFPKMLKSSGWELTDYINMDEITEKWYAELISKFDEKRSSLIKVFPKDIYEHSYKNYIGIYNDFKKKVFGAGIFYAKKL